MKHKRQESKLRAFISRLMQGSSEEEVFAAEQSFRSYLEIARRIQRRKQAEKQETIDG